MYTADGSNLSGDTKCGRTHLMGRLDRRESAVLKAEGKEPAERGRIS